jgi:hypothetical protein
MYAGVPSTLPDSDSSTLDPLRTVAITLTAAEGSGEGSSTIPPCFNTLARPQSMTCTSPKEPTITLDGFRSRWMTPRAWA